MPPNTPQSPRTPCVPDRRTVRHWNAPRGAFSPVRDAASAAFEGLLIGLALALIIGAVIVWAAAQKL